MISFEQMKMSKARQADPAFYAAHNMLNTQPGYGYLPRKYENYQLSDMMSMYRYNGGIPELLHVAGLSVNYNRLTNTSFESNTTSWIPYVNGGSAIVPVVSNENQELKVEPQGTYAFTGVRQTNVPVEAGKTYILSGQARGSLAAWNLAFYFGSPSNQNAAQIFSNIKQPFSFVFISANTGNYDMYFRSDTAGLTSFWLDNLQLTEVAIGATSALPYRPRTDATTVQSLNLGSASINGNGTFVNGSSASMTTVSNVAGSVYEFNSVSTQSYITTYSVNTNYTYIGWFRVSDFSAIRTILSNDTGGALNVRNSSAGNSQIVIAPIGNVPIITSTASVATNAWTFVAFTYSGSSVSMYLYNALINETQTVAGSGYLAGNIKVGGRSDANFPMQGQINNVAVRQAVLTQSQIQNIYNSQKSQFGL